MDQLPLDSEFIFEKKRRPLWQRIAIFVIGAIILLFGILIILNLIDLFNLLGFKDPFIQAWLEP